MTKRKHRTKVVVVIGLLLLFGIAIGGNVLSIFPYDLSAMSRSIGQSVKASVSGTEKEHMVYVTKTGEKYHSAFCRYLRYSSEEMTIQDAESKGLDPCSKCTP